VGRPKPAETSALSIALESESLQALFSAWLELRQQHAASLAALNKERDQLESRAQLVLKAVEAARGLPEVAVEPKTRAKKSRLPAVRDPLAEFQAQAEAELALARKQLERRFEAQAHEWEKLDARVRKALLARADQHLSIHKPQVKLTVHPVGKQSLLEVAAFGEEDAVLLARLLSGKLPTRWGFFADDAVEDLARGPSHFYPDEGRAELWPADADAEDAILFSNGDFVPLRMQIPFAIPERAFPRFKLVHHGLIAQVETRREGEPYSHLVRREDGELLAGYLLRLRIAGKLELVLSSD
jgi:hypothetical protein